MRIIIIGGGAAGMISAHYLARKHRVTVIEREPVLGGNIRTLNGNVPASRLPADLVMDNGVIEFLRDHSPGLTALMADLGLALEPIDGGSSALFLANGCSYQMPHAIRSQGGSIGRRCQSYWRLGTLLRQLIPVRLAMARHAGNKDSEVKDFLGNDTASNWIRMLLMYAYSTPFAEIDRFPARLAIATLRQCGVGTRWARLPGGVYRYIEAIIQQAGDNLRVITGTAVSNIHRHHYGVSVYCREETLRADKLVIATTPDQVLPLLDDPDEQELRWFSPWQGNRITTVIHTDDTIYSKWGKPGFNEFDVFEKAGTAAGYNAYLNRLCGLRDDHGRSYFLSYNLEDWIAPDAVVHRQLHATPLYTVAAYRQVDGIKAANGHRNTCYAGAYLYNGLHEGAAESALALRELLC